MRRREFFILAIGLVLARPQTARTQQAAKPVVGFLSSLSRDPTAHLTAGFLQGLADAGFVDGQNVVVEYRWAEGQYDRLPKLAAELIDHPVAVLFGAAPPAALAAKAAAAKIPVVFVSGDDPIRSGLVDRLNQPGGNVSGISVYSGSQLGTKHIELLHELVPAAAAIALLVNPANSKQTEGQIELVQAAAHSLGVRLNVVKASNEKEFGNAFETLKDQQTHALIIDADPLSLAVALNS